MRCRATSILRARRATSNGTHTHTHSEHQSGPDSQTRMAEQHVACRDLLRLICRHAPPAYRTTPQTLRAL
ncbi:hypothetical protein RRG08_031180 [Elysia crispata]|uniref:Uncharacterized protein n=1 Tax=Elysia crispata TaxID=231223 RepID=A0AAE1DFB4_9GAST|nr:hypothetical protein RRG08_031180 [Elysia crispata]